MSSVRVGAVAKTPNEPTHYAYQVRERENGE
jgi:hypothetical protein